MRVEQSDRTISLETGDTVPATWQQVLIDYSVITRRSKNETIIYQGDVSRDIYYICMGSVRCVQYAQNGDTTILRTLGPGHIFGELSAFDGGVRSITVEAIDNCQLAKLSADDFHAFLREIPNAYQWMTRQLAIRIRSLTEKTMQLARMPVNARIQNELLRLAIEHGVQNDTAVVTSLPTHEDIASRLGTHREAVSKEMSRLAKESIAKQSGRKLTVLSVKKLEALLCKTGR